MAFAAPSCGPEEAVAGVEHVPETRDLEIWVYASSFRQQLPCPDVAFEAATMDGEVYTSGSTDLTGQATVPVLAGAACRLRLAWGGDDKEFILSSPPIGEPWPFGEELFEILLLPTYGTVQLAVDPNDRRLARKAEYWAVHYGEVPPCYHKDRVSFPGQMSPIDDWDRFACLDSISLPSGLVYSWFVCDEEGVFLAQGKLDRPLVADEVVTVMLEP